MTIYRIQRAGVLARLGRMDEALADMRIATATDHVGINLISRAALELEAGDVASAFATAQRAVAVSPYEPTVALNAGLIAERAGDRAFALDQFAITVVVSPPLAGAEIWDDPARLVTRDEILDAARAFLDPVHGALITAYAGDASQALDELSSLPASRLRDVHLAAAQWLAGDPEGAKEALIQLVDGDPRDTYAAAWLARIARRSGDEVTAERYTRWTILNQADASTGTIYELSEVGAEGPAAAAALPLTYPRPIYMRRAGSYVLAPQLLVIGAR
jgi:tetratricopeptide (TPR) repeat protein